MPKDYRKKISISWVQKGLKIEFETTAIFIFRNSIKRAFSGMFTLLLGQKCKLLHIYPLQIDVLIK
jgi:hypothetical protein